MENNSNSRQYNSEKSGLQQKKESMKLVYFQNNNIDIAATVKELAKEPLKNHTQEAICRKIYKVKNEIQQDGRIRQERRGKLWTQAEDEIIINEIEKKGENINVPASVVELHKELLKYRSEDAIKFRMYKFLKELKKYGQIRQEQIRQEQYKKPWNQEELEIIEKIAIELIKNSKNTNTSASVGELQIGPSKYHSEITSEGKTERLKKQLQYTPEKNKITENAGAENININSQNNNETSKNLLRELEKSLNKYINNNKQFKNTENRITKINTSENNKSNFICFNRENDKKEDLKQLLDDLCDAESEISEIVYINLSFKPSNKLDKDPIFQHPYLSLPDISDLSSSEHSI